eukprot:3248516-Rhodomonas_salina.1
MQWRGASARGARVHHVLTPSEAGWSKCSLSNVPTRRGSLAANSGDVFAVVFHLHVNRRAQGVVTREPVRVSGRGGGAADVR